MLRNTGTIRILFTNFVDADNFNAQSLNAREIALRLDPKLFHSTLFYERSPDSRLLGRRSVQLIKIPPRLGTLRMLAETLKGYNIVFRANLIRFTYLYLHVPKSFRPRTTIVDWLEGYSPSYSNELDPKALKYYNFIQSRIQDRISITYYVARKSLESFGFQSRGIIPVGVDTRFFVPPPNRQNTVPVVLFVGHLIERKGPQYVVKAAQHFPNVRFVLVGDQRGDFYPTLCSMVKESRLENVVFEAPMNREGLVQLMQSSDLLLHPSFAEGLPKVVLEAAATGLPAIIFDQYQAPAVIDGATGFQVRAFEEMVDRLRLLIHDRDLRLKMGAEAVKHVKQFDWAVVVKQWEEVFQEAVTENRASA